jgi:hypothetical protein
MSAGMAMGGKQKRDEDPVDKQPANTIVAVKGQQAAVTFGTGISTQELNDALGPSKLFTLGAAHGVNITNLLESFRKANTDYRKFVQVVVGA